MLQYSSTNNNNNSNNNKIEQIKLDFSSKNSSPILYGRTREVDILHGIYEQVFSEQFDNPDDAAFLSQNITTTAAPTTTAAHESLSSTPSQPTTASSSSSSSSSSSLQPSPPSSSRGHLIVLHGKAGVGKTALAHTLLHETSSSSDNGNRVFFASGKYDHGAASGFTAAQGALKMACSQLCELILKSPDREIIGQRIRDTMGRGGVTIFQRYVPKLKKLMDMTCCDGNGGGAIGGTTSTTFQQQTLLLPPEAAPAPALSSSHLKQDNNYDARSLQTREEWGLERLKGLMSEFLRAVCGNLSPHKRPITASHHEHNKPLSSDSKLLGATATTTTTTTSTATSSESHRKVVVLFIDDIQWADHGSIQLLRFLATDQLSKGLLIIASYRDEEVTPDSCLLQELQWMQEPPQNRLLQVTRIAVNDLDLMGVNELVASVTCRRDADDTMPLARVIHDKTQGNAFFVIQFLKRMEDEGYLYFAAHSLRWEWDLEAIESEMRLADNVVEWVAHKIQRLPAEAQTALKIAACIGSTINARIVDYLSSHVHRFITYDGLLNHGILQLFQAINSNNNCEDNDCKDMDEDEKDPEHAALRRRQQAWIDVFDSLADEGLVNKRKKGSDTYVWSHDRIMESAYSLVPSGDDRKWIHYQIGEALKRMDHCPLGDNWKLTTATDQLNRASSVIVDEEARVELAHMNLQAAKAVASISAFYQAVKYLREGIALLDERTKWNRNYDLSLELYNSLAEFEKYIGHHDACRQVVHEVLQHGKTLSDKFRSYLVLVESLGSQRENVALVDLAVSLSARLKEPLPRKAGKVRIMFEVLRTQQLVGRRTDEDILGMPPITDERVHQALSLFSRLHRLTWNAGNIPLTILIRLKMTQLILKHGCSEFSGPALALYGCILAKFGKLEQAYRFGVLAMQIVDRFPIEETQTLLYVNLHLQIIKKPLSHSLEPLLRTHRAGLEKGDIIFSGALAYCVFYFFQGLPLGPLQEDARAFAGLMTQYGNVACANFINFYRQVALNLMGRSKNLNILTGEALDLGKIEQEALAAKNHVTLLFSWTSQSVLAAFTGDEELGAAMFQKLEKVDLLPEYFPGAAILGLVSAFLARTTGNRKYARRTHLIAKQLNALLKKGSVNYLHFLFILKAELAALRGKVDSATHFYAAAIRSAAQTGFTNFEALAAERAGIFALERDTGDTFWASTYLSRAVFLYSEWGATAKVEQLKLKYPALINETGRGRRPSAHLKGRQRFDQKLVDQHRDSAHKLVLRLSETSETLS